MINLWLWGLLTIGGAIAASICGLVWVRRRVPAHSLREQHDVAGFILAIVGVVYAVLLAFVILVVWEQFENAKVVAEREATSVLNIYHLTSGFAPSVTKPLHLATRDFARSVVNDDWPAMQQGKASDQTARALDRLWRDISGIKPLTAREGVIYDQILTRLSEVSDNRHMRLLASRNGVPGPMWVVILFGGVATILFTYFFGLEKLKSQIAMTGLLAATIGSMIFIISALDYPFSGDMRVTSEAMETVVSRLDDIDTHESGRSEKARSNSAEPD